MPMETAPSISEDTRSCARLPTVFVASDVALVSEGLCLQLVRNCEIELLGSSQPSPALISHLVQLVPDVLILDFGSRNSRDFALHLRHSNVSTRIVGIAIGKSRIDIVDWAKLGIAGFVDDDGMIDDVISAVKVVARGEFSSSARTAALLVSGFVGRPSGKSSLQARPRLTSRETQILLGLERGVSNKEIARMLGISPATVKNHIHNLLAKLEVTRRQEAVALVRSGLF